MYDSLAGTFDMIKAAPPTELAGWIANESLFNGGKAFWYTISNYVLRQIKAVISDIEYAPSSIFG